MYEMLKKVKEFLEKGVLSFQNYGIHISEEKFREYFPVYEVEENMLDAIGYRYELFFQYKDTRFYCVSNEK
jgi:hypothetical protein